MTNMGILGAGRGGTNLAGRSPEDIAARTTGLVPRVAFADRLRLG
ncbi:hypothetical protein ACFVRB_31325 [Streptomyces nojiriensis]